MYDHLISSPALLAIIGIIFIGLVAAFCIPASRCRRPGAAEYRLVTEGMAPQLMLDIETFGLTPGSQVRSLGAVLFDPSNGEAIDSFYCALDIDEQVAVGLTADQSTVEWWQKQSSDAQDAFDSPAPAHEALLAFNDWYSSANKPTVWALGSYFDFVLLGEVYRRLGLQYPIHHRKQCCMRSIAQLTQLNWGRERTAHHALQDAARQARVLSDAFSRLREVKPAEL